jgi:HEAT repeat protein
MENSKKTPRKVESQQNSPHEVSDRELLDVIKDFLEMGHVENIVAMFRQDARYYDWTGDLLDDERFVVRLGVSVLFEHLIEKDPDRVELAIPSLARQLGHAPPWVRGEAVSVLGIIGSERALEQVRPMVNDKDAQVAEVARDILGLTG